MPSTNGNFLKSIAGSTVTAGSFVVGTQYTILTVGTTSFTAIGASANTVGVVFTATGVGSGTGTATINQWSSETQVIYTPIGVGQTWQDVSASRASGTTYTNSTGRPIFISVRWDRDDGTLELTVDSLPIGKTGNTQGAVYYTLTAIIPSGSTYIATATGSGGTLSWYELR